MRADAIRGCSPKTISPHRDAFKLPICYLRGEASVPPERITLELAALSLANPVLPRAREHTLHKTQRCSDGAILSPLLANIALSVLDRRFEKRTPGTPARHISGSGGWPRDHPSDRMIRYADDFVILVRRTKAPAQALKEQTAEFMSEQMRLTLSPGKTHITHVDDGFDFLGVRIKRSPHGRIPVAYSFPIERSFREVKRRIKELTGRSTIGCRSTGSFTRLIRSFGVGPTITATPRPSVASVVLTTTSRGG